MSKTPRSVSRVFRLVLILIVKKKARHLVSYQIPKKVTEEYAFDVDYVRKLSLHLTGEFFKMHAPYICTACMYFWKPSIGVLSATLEPCLPLTNAKWFLVLILVPV